MKTVAKTVSILTSKSDELFNKIFKKLLFIIMSTLLTLGWPGGAVTPTVYRCGDTDGVSVR